MKSLTDSYKLSNGVKIPCVGIDTARAYGNEELYIITMATEAFGPGPGEFAHRVIRGGSWRNTASPGLYSRKKICV
jgi:hypothetical protein